MTKLSIVTYFQQPATYEYFNELLLITAGSNALPGVFETNPLPNMVNASLWTLLYEVLLYIFVLLIWLFGLLRKRTVLLLFFGLITLRFITIWLYPQLNVRIALLDIVGAKLDSDRLEYFFYLQTLFLSGTLLYLFRDKIHMKRRYLFIGFLFMLLSLLVKPQGLFNIFILPTYISYVIFYVASIQTSPLRNFGRYGDFSYGMYIYAFPIQQSLVSIFGGTMLPILNFLLASGITLIIAILSWHFIEKPALSLKKRRLTLFANMTEKFEKSDTNNL